MNDDIPKTVSGKVPSQNASFRLPWPEYLKAVELCKKKGLTLSAYTAQLWQKELERNES